MENAHYGSMAVVTRSQSTLFRRFSIVGARRRWPGSFFHKLRNDLRDSRHLLSTKFVHFKDRLVAERFRPDRNSEGKGITQQQEDKPETGEVASQF